MLTQYQSFLIICDNDLINQLNLGYNPQKYSSLDEKTGDYYLCAIGIILVDNPCFRELIRYHNQDSLSILRIRKPDFYHGLMYDLPFDIYTAMKIQNISDTIYYNSDTYSQRVIQYRTLLLNDLCQF